MEFDLLQVYFFVLVVAQCYQEVLTTKVPDDPAANQIVTFKRKTSRPVAILTTSTGAPVNCSDTFSTLNKRVLHNEFLMETVTNFARERIPERVVHTKAAGAFGYFEVTRDITDICKAKFVNKVGKRTPVAVRLSITFGDKGGIDTVRGGRGFAIKFYTEEGNFDIVGINTPLCGYKDPLVVPELARSSKRNPATNLLDSNMSWDHFLLHPESTYSFLLSHGELGIPDGYRHMPGFGIHTYQVVNDDGETYFIRFHFIPDLGIKGLSSEEGKRLANEDPDYATKDLYNAIARGEFPSWTASIQVLSWNDIKNADFDVFDVSRILPEDKYPLRQFGRLVLDTNPVNYFAEVEQLAYNPTNLVPGIVGSPDKVFEVRRLAYREAHLYRLGANFNNIPVNCPLHKKATYLRDGVPPVNDNMRDVPNYYPNSFHGPVPYKEKNGVALIEIYEEEPDNIEQTQDLYNGMSAKEKNSVVQNIVNELSSATKFLQERALRLFATISLDLSARVRAGLNATYAP